MNLKKLMKNFHMTRFKFKSKLENLFARRDTYKKRNHFFSKKIKK